jgi:hypothetical protein
MRRIAHQPNRAKRRQEMVYRVGLRRMVTQRWTMLCCSTYHSYGSAMPSAICRQFHAEDYLNGPGAQPSALPAREEASNAAKLGAIRDDGGRPARERSMPVMDRLTMMRILAPMLWLGPLGIDYRLVP